MRRRARNVSSFGLFTDLNLALVFLLIPGARRSQNKSVYPNRRRTSQISDGLSSGAGRRGPGCASDRHIRGVVARVSRPGILFVHDIYIQLCPGDTVEARPPSVLLSRHAQVPGVFLWSSSVRRSRVRPGHLQRPPTPFI